ncbi:MAG TPA: hypothetical protein V6C95_14320 [Coleofasciculaceae cyanobacterium]
MKELQTGLQLIKEKCIQLNQHPLFHKKASKSAVARTLPQPVTNRQKPRVSFPPQSPLVVLRQRTAKGLKRIEHQAERINQLSAELETAILELKAIASEVNRDWRALQATQKPTTGAIASFVPNNVCEYQSVNIPSVQHKRSGSFVLTSRPVDLFKAEREANLLAQTLRHRARKKRMKNL